MTNKKGREKCQHNDMEERRRKREKGERERVERDREGKCEERITDLKERGGEKSGKKDKKKVKERRKTEN